MSNVPYFTYLEAYIRTLEMEEKSCETNVHGARTGPAIWLDRFRQTDFCVRLYFRAQGIVMRLKTSNRPPVCGLNLLFFLFSTAV